MTTGLNPSIDIGLSVSGITHRFGEHHVVRNASLSINRGEIACLLGPSGCGKTTLLRIAAGLERLQGGRVVIGDRVVAETGQIDLPPEDRSVGLMFQDYALFPHLTVAENIGFGLAKGQADARARINERLAMMGLDGYRDRYPHELSGGQQQRVALLRAIAPKPAVLLLDEPFTGLDTSLRSQVRDQTLELLAVENQTALMVTHDPEEAMYMADRLFVMNSGEIVQGGPPVDVYTQPVNAFVAGLFGPLNRFTATVSQEAKVTTPVGTLSAKGFEPGTIVEVLVRPESITLSDAAPTSPDASPPLRIAWCRSIGRSTQVGLVADGIADGTIAVRIPGRFSGQVGDMAHASAVDTDVFMFAIGA